MTTREAAGHRHLICAVQAATGTLNTVTGNHTTQCLTKGGRDKGQILPTTIFSRLFLDSLS